MLALKRIASGDYETQDGAYTIYQIPGVNPPAWNAEDIGEPYAVIVDGAATLRDARGLLEEWIAFQEAGQEGD